MHLIVRYMSVFYLMFFMNACGMGVLQEVDHWYKTGNRELFKNKCVPSKSARDFSDEPCLQKLFEYWTLDLKKLDEKNKRNKRKIKKMRKQKKRSREIDFLEKEAAEQCRLAEERVAVKRHFETDANYAEDVLNELRCMYQKRAERSEDGLFCTEETYEGVSFYLMYDRYAWYLFDSQYKKLNPYLRSILKSLQEQSIEKQLPGIAPVYYDRRFIYLFAGIKKNSQLSCNNLIAAITCGGNRLTCKFRILEQIKLEREHPYPSIQPKVGDCTSDEEEAIYKKCFS